MTIPLDRVLSATALREAIRAKCRSGGSRHAISRLIAFYVPANIVAKGDDGPHRLPVEVIAPHQRTAFLEALQRLPSSHSLAPISSAADDSFGSGAEA